MSDLSLHDKNIMRQVAENLNGEKTILSDVLRRIGEDAVLNDESAEVDQVRDLLDDCIAMLVDLAK
jgi:hypothetical protein